MHKSIVTRCCQALLLGSFILFTACGSKCVLRKNHTTHSSTDQQSQSYAELHSAGQQLGSKIYFAFDSSELSKEAKAIVQEQAKLAKEKIKQDQSVIMIEGHADERGTVEYNYALGERRANAVKQELVLHGINSNRITITSYGKERPEAEGNNEEAWSKNRRAKTSAVHANE